MTLGIPQQTLDPEPALGQSGLDPAGRVVMSLSVVLGAFFLAAWFGRKRSQGNTALPAEAVELLGEMPIGRDSARLIRVGSKLVLVAATRKGMNPLTEVTDPEEERRLSELCDVMQSGASSRWREEAV